MSVNPYAAPAARVEDVAANSEAEAIRQAHIGHEASIKSVGILYYIGAVVTVVGGVAAIGGARPDPLMALIFIAVGVLGFFAGYGVRALRQWGRVLGCVLSVLGLLGFPIGTLVNGYILYLFLSKKGRTIFSADYQEIIAATPHVKYRTSIIVWIVLALLIALVVAGLVLPQLAGR